MTNDSTRGGGGTGGVRLTYQSRRRPGDCHVATSRVLLLLFVSRPFEYGKLKSIHEKYKNSIRHFMFNRENLALLNNIGLYIERGGEGYVVWGNNQSFEN
jgi:hypothetical protein